MTGVFAGRRNKAMWINQRKTRNSAERLSRMFATIQLCCPVAFVALLCPLVVLPAFGQAAESSAPAGIQYVSPNGSDSHSGKSWSQAKATIQAALKALPQIGNHGGHGKVFLSGGNYRINSTVVIPSGTIVEGTAPGSHPVTIQASPSFPHNTPLVSFGTRLGNEGVRLERVAVDCLDIPGATGVENKYAEENSGLTDVSIVDCPGRGLYDVSENSFNRNVVVSAGKQCTDCSAGTLPAEVSSHGINGLTLDFREVSVKPDVGIILNDASLSNAHCEGIVSCYQVSSEDSLFSVNCGSAVTAGAVTNCVRIRPGSNGFFVAEVWSTGHVTNVLNDPDRHVRIATYALPLYAVSPGPPGDQEIFASNNGVPFTAYSFRTNSGQSVLLAGVNGVSSGTITLSSGSGSHLFAHPYRSAPVCTASDDTRAAAVRVRSNRTAVEFSGTGDDAVTWICTPAAN